MKKVLLFAVVFSCSMWANAQRVTWATEAGLSAIQRTGYGECWRPSTRLGISADYNVNNMFSMKSGLYYTFRGYSVNNGGTYSNGDATWIENVSQTRHFLQVPILAKFSIHSNNSTKFFFEIGPYVGYCIKNHIDSNPYYLTMPSSGWIEGYPGVGESAEGGYPRTIKIHLILLRRLFLIKSIEIIQEDSDAFKCLLRLVFYLNCKFNFSLGYATQVL